MENSPQTPSALTPPDPSPAPAPPPNTSLVPIPPPVPVRPRLDGWTAERQRAFIEHLADHGDVRAACAHVGMSKQSAFDLRRRPDATAFAEAWIAALENRQDGLVETAVDRAIHGSLRARYWKGEKVGEERVPSDRMLMWLITKGSMVIDAAQRRKRGQGALENRVELLEDVDETGRPHFRLWTDVNCYYRTDAPLPPDVSEEEIAELDIRGVFGHKGYSRRITEEEDEALHREPVPAQPTAADEAARRAIFGLS